MGTIGVLGLLVYGGFEIKLLGWGIIKMARA